MRLTSDTQDKLAWVQFDLADIETRIDGEVAHHVITADDVEGYAIVFKPGSPAPDVVTGEVEFVPMNDDGEKLLEVLRKRWEILAGQYNERSSK